MAARQAILDALGGGRLDDALAVCAAALSEGETAELHYLHGLILHAGCRLPEAATALEKAARLAPTQPDVAYAQGVVARESGYPDEAIAHWRRAQGHAGALYNLALAASERGDDTEAEAGYQALLAHRPDHGDALYNLANLRFRRGDFAEAEAGYARVVAGRPGHAQAWVNAGMVADALGRPGEAELRYRRALALDGQLAEGHWNLALNRLAQGRWAEGFAEFEWRLALNDAPVPTWSMTEWRGNEPAGSSVLVWNDQGNGDAIQFLRYARCLADKGYKVVAVVQDGLATVAATVPGVAAAYGFSQRLPPLDRHLPLLSLPHRLGLNDPAASWPGPYVGVAPAQHFKRRGEPAVGVVWAGNPAHRNDARRSMALERLAPLIESHAFDWVSLQVGAAAGALAGSPLAAMMRQPAPPLGDFSDTAAIIAQLDLVITVDTAVAHLAGAMGKAVWVMLPAVGLDWRWPRTGTRSDWYPTMRLFHQPQPGDWDSVVSEVSNALRKATIPHLIPLDV